VWDVQTVIVKRNDGVNTNDQLLYNLIKRKTYTAILSTSPPPPYMSFTQDKKQQSALKKSGEKGITPTHISSTTL